MATENDKVNTGALGTIVAVGLFATLSVAFAVTALVRYSVQGVVDQRQSLAQREYRDLRSAQVGKLEARPTWTDKSKGLLSIPIERAKMKVLAELTRDPTSATPAPPPSAAPAGSGSPEAAPSAAPSPTAANDKAPAPPGTVASAKAHAPSAHAPKPTDG
ncbi:MAG TPA: hypothetical protein VMI75_19190 [Polyangiaceae bacterium]|nr:hypothetical protein [Polyangiaceae bacterium]